MASHIQYHDNACWSCRPCCVGDARQEAGFGAKLTSKRRSFGRSEMKPTEELLASELNKLSVQERTAAFDDLHCVAEDLQETPEMVDKSLAEFELLVQKKRTPAYDLAWSQNRAYVEDPSFRLRFLHANLHNVDKSVRQMMNFLKHKANYFGNDKVARDITLDDLDEDDKQVILSGLWHVQEERDRSGRVIIHTFGNVIKRCTAEGMIRGGFFIYNNILLRDPSVQMKGLVALYQNASKPGDSTFGMPSLDFIMKVNDASASFPIRYSAMHFCLHSNEGNLNLTNAFLKPLLNTLPQHARVRSRIHIGSATELQYELRSHGIPLDTFPIDMNGNVRENILNHWLATYLLQTSHTSNGHAAMTNSVGGDGTHVTSWAQRQYGLGAPEPSNQRRLFSHNEEGAPFAISPSAAPTENDVLLGRGKFAQNWAGNVKFREFIQKEFVAYNKIPTSQRTKRTIELTQELMDNGVRFFGQQESGEWVEADCTEARQKVSQMFRSLRKKKSNGAC